MSPPPATSAAFSIASRLRSVAYALAGIGFMLRTQHNAWLHLVATIGVVVLGVVFGVAASDWRWLVASIFVVWSAECFNTAVEYVCDVVSPDFSEAVKHAKDISAGAVLISAVGAAVIGAITFWPYLRAAF